MLEEKLTEIANRYKISRIQLYRLLKEYKLSKEQFLKAEKLLNHLSRKKNNNEIRQ